MASTGGIPHTRLAHRDAALTELAEIERQGRQLDARRLEVMAGLLSRVCGSSEQTDEMAYRSLRLEVGMTTGLGEAAAERLLNTAWRAHAQYPRTLAALREGEISLDHLRVVADAGAVLTTGAPEDEQRRAAYERDALGYAREETPNRLRPIARRLAAELAEASLAERHEEARQRRSVRVVDADEGMADLIAHLPAEEAHAIKDRLTRIAGEVAATEAAQLAQPARAGSGANRTEAEAAVAPPRRSRDEIRADALCDLLLERSGATADVAQRVQAQVQVVVPGEVVGLPPVGGVPELVGHGPIGAEAAARIAANSEAWERVAVSEAGEVLSVERYRPTPQMRRALAARDLHCRAPGCRAPAHRCDIDHTVDAALGGATRTDNLAHLCRGHHTLKHHSEWSVTQESGGVMRWRSPTGREYRDKPASRVRFRRTGTPGPRRE